MGTTLETIAVCVVITLLYHIGRRLDQIADRLRPK